MSGSEIAYFVTYNNVKQLKLHFHVCRLCLTSKRNILTTLTKLFRKVIMRNDVTGCVIFISNKIEFLEK